MEKDLVKVAISTVTAITILNILTHGSAATGIVGALFGGWSKILNALTGQRV